MSKKIINLVEKIDKDTGKAGVIKFLQETLAEVESGEREMDGLMIIGITEDKDNGGGFTVFKDKFNLSGREVVSLVEMIKFTTLRDTFD